MNNYEDIINQTIQLFPQLFLGKHWRIRALGSLVKPSDKVGDSGALREKSSLFHSSGGIRRLGVRHKVNLGEHA